MVNWFAITTEERVAIQQKFNELFESRDKTLEEIAKELDITREVASLCRSKWYRRSFKNKQNVNLE